MYICLCKGVNATTIMNSIDAGNTSLQLLAQDCGAGADCGSCREELTQELEKHSLTVTPTSSSHSDS